MLLSEKFRVVMLLDMLAISLNIFYWATLKKEAAGSCEMLVNNNVPGDKCQKTSIFANAAARKLTVAILPS
jgi:hypothetical protein